MTLSLDLKSLGKLGPKCLLVFLAGTVGVIIGGPMALYLAKILFPNSIHPDAWKVLAPLAGSWIGGGVNQASMKEVFQVSEDLFMYSVAVDILVGAFLWMSFLLFLANKNTFMNKWLKADQKLQDQIDLSETEAKPEVAGSLDYCWIIALGFGGTALARFIAVPLTKAINLHAPSLAQYNLTSSFFWVIILASLFGVIISLTPLRNLESKGASKIGSVFLLLIVASIGMKVNLLNIWTSPIYFFIGLVWILIHLIVIMSVTRFLRVPLFFMAVGSQANIGGAASAPLVASAFSPHLAPVGVILAILGYVLGNYGAWVSGMLMKWVQS